MSVAAAASLEGDNIKKIYSPVTSTRNNNIDEMREMYSKNVCPICHILFISLKLYHP
jgi:hypothetical protein